MKLHNGNRLRDNLTHKDHEQATTTKLPTKWGNSQRVGDKSGIQKNEITHSNSLLETTPGTDKTERTKQDYRTSAQRDGDRREGKETEEQASNLSLASLRD